MPLHPDFPVVTGRTPITAELQVDLPVSMNRRLDDGSLVFWCPGLTVWIDVYQTEQDDRSLTDRVEEGRTNAHPAATGIDIESQPGSLRLIYHLAAGPDTGETASAFYTHLHTSQSWLVAAVYYDDDPAPAESIARSFSLVTPPSSPE